MAAKSPVRNYRDLRVWQAGIELAEHVYRLTEVFPKLDTYENAIVRAEEFIIEK